MHAFWKGVIALGLITTSLAAIAQKPASTDVTIESGRIRGSASDGVRSFKGIPFAAPPIGDNRWRAPQPVTPWSGVRQATAFGHDCMQKPFPSDAAPLGEVPSEDCLYLNVWRPDTPNVHKLPVMVWIYGGGYVNGGASPDVYDGSAFARDGVVLVSFNYRLGRFGFFAHPALTNAQADGKTPLGNYGYMDQIAALNWVKRNIAQFGGDPNNVTVFGESAGGDSTLNLTISPAAKGLFSRAAVMSGGGRVLMGELHDLSEDRPGNPSAETIGLNFAESVGIEGTGPDALKALRALPAEKVLGDLNMATLLSPSSGPVTYAGGPIRDGVIVTHTPQEAYSTGQQAQVPMLIGTTSADLGFSFAQTMHELFAPFGDNAERARTLYDPQDSGDVQAIGAKIGMDRMMTEPARFTARHVVETGQPAYLYRFSHVAEPMRDEWQGAPHASEIPYLFKTLEARYDGELSDTDRITAEAMHDYFVNFAKRGNPNGEELPYWPRYTPQEDKLMNFTQTNGPLVEQDPWTERLDLIQDLQPSKTP